MSPDSKKMHDEEDGIVEESISYCSAFDFAKKREGASSFARAGAASATSTTSMQTQDRSGLKSGLLSRADDDELVAGTTTVSMSRCEVPPSSRFICTRGMSWEGAHMTPAWLRTKMPSLSFTSPTHRWVADVEGNQPRLQPREWTMGMIDAMAPRR
jgi:hypothetical protein